MADLGSGFFSLSLSFEETGQLIDDTYAFYLYQEGLLLKHGRVRLVENEFPVFNYTLDFLLG